MNGIRGLMMDGWKDVWRRGGKKGYKGLDGTSFLLVSKQLTIEGQRNSSIGRQQ